jgi:hypothetical protein
MSCADDTGHKAPLYPVSPMGGVRLQVDALARGNRRRAAAICLASLVLQSTLNLLVRCACDLMLWRLFHHVCVHGAADRHKRENMAEGAVSIIKHFQGVALMIKL